MKLSLSIVSYHSHIPTLKRVLASLGDSLEQAKVKWPNLQTTLFFIDNDSDRSGSQGVAVELNKLKPDGVHQLEIIHNDRNVGYGGGHNRCLNYKGQGLDSDYHLILNPDVILADDYFEQGLSFLEQETDVVAVAPYVSDENNQPAYLCKRYPTVCDLGLRGFTPKGIQNKFQQRLDKYQMKDVYDAEQVNKHIPIISGCCMLIRTEAFVELNGFDDRFFLYFEDFDLSLRLSQKGKVAYHPNLKIKHLGGFSAQKGFWHIGQFVKSAKQFFDKHGWCFL